MAVTPLRRAALLLQDVLLGTVGQRDVHRMVESENHLDCPSGQRHPVDYAVDLSIDVCDAPDAVARGSAAYSR